MKSAALIFLSVVISLFLLNSSSQVLAQRTGNQDSNVTLYSVIKYKGEQRKSCINFKLAPAGLLRVPCDLRYGSLYVNDDLDWFESSTGEGNRSVIKDLGNHDWLTEFSVPVVLPLAKLKPGERRNVTVDVSGAAGADGAPGKSGGSASSITRGRREQDTSSLLPIDPGPVPGDIAPTVLTAQPRDKPRPPKQDGKPKIDPLWVKAVAGHMYVIHIVDDARDFYALFRVDALERGDYCTVSWKLIPEPVNQSGASADK